jgi:hypothetical protein
LENNRHKFRLIEDDFGNLGTSASLQIVLKNLKGAKYLAFADQDDIWMPRHLINAVSLLNSANKLLFFPRYQLMNSKGSKEKILKRKEKVELCNAIVENQIIGCGIVLSEAGFQLIQRLNLSNKLHLDWQLYFLFSALESIVQGDEIGVLYRIHSNNSVGIRKRSDYFKAAKIKKAIHLAKQKNDVFEDLYVQIKPSLPRSSIIFLANYFLVLKKGIHRKVIYTLTPGFKRSSLFDQFIYKLIFLIQKS